MLLILSNEDVSRLITMPDAIEALRISNREVAALKRDSEYRLNRARTNHYLPWDADASPDGQAVLRNGAGNDPRLLYNFKSMEGGSLHFGVWALRSSSDLVKLSTGPYGQLHTYLRYGDLPGGHGYSDLIFLYNIHNAQFEAIIQAAVLQGIRVAATSALGTDYLCRAEVLRAGMFGSGWQAAANLRALLHIRPGIKQVKVFSPNQAKREAFARRMCEELHIDVVAVDTPEDAARGMDIIYEASSSRTPVFDGRLLEEGQHVMSLGAGDEHFKRRLIDPVGVARCDTVAVHSLEVKYGLEEISDCVESGAFDWDRVVDLPDLVSGHCKPDVSGRSISFFKNNVGLGSQFAAVGGLVLKNAKERGMGFELPQGRVSQVMER
ncbi:ornithine cyclodeaminase family protein [Pseudorhodoplanes sp.]|uniref:ornithine cyclodeaminase family protein n=1 Tax=Pseudorhodoplanes sp. TaxID=1934341 RepID=UPI003D0C0001